MFKEVRVSGEIRGPHEDSDRLVSEGSSAIGLHACSCFGGVGSGTDAPRMSFLCLGYRRDKVDLVVV